MRKTLATIPRPGPRPQRMARIRRPHPHLRRPEAGPPLERHPTAALPRTLQELYQEPVHSHHPPIPELRHPSARRHRSIRKHERATHATPTVFHEFERGRVAVTVYAELQPRWRRVSDPTDAGLDAGDAVLVEFGRGAILELVEPGVLQFDSYGAVAGIPEVPAGTTTTRYQYDAAMERLDVDSASGISFCVYDEHDADGSVYDELRLSSSDSAIRFVRRSPGDNFAADAAEFAGAWVEFLHEGADEFAANDQQHGIPGAGPGGEVCKIWDPEYGYLSVLTRSFKGCGLAMSFHGSMFGKRGGKASKFGWIESSLAFGYLQKFGIALFRILFCIPRNGHTRTTHSILPLRGS